MNREVVLINMPFFGTDRPSLGLSLLKSQLRREGINAHIYYFNILFSRIVGILNYRRIESAPTTLLLGEWIFAESLWGPNRGRDDEYIALLRDGIESLKSRWPGTTSPDDLVRIALECRRKAETFLEHCALEIPWESVGVVGFSSTFQQQIASLALAMRVKSRYPEVHCVFGGANCESEMGEALFEAFPFIGAVCVGEGDLVFPRYVERILGGGPFHQLAGMYQRDSGVGPSPITGAGGAEDDFFLGMPPPADIGSLPIPDYDDYFSVMASSEQGDGPVLIPFETSRGCWWGQRQHCTFCGLNGLTMKFREKPASRALDEILALGRRYSGPDRVFEAVDNILPMSYFESLLPELARLRLGYQFFYETKSNLRPDQVRLLSRAGVTCIQPGIESLSTPVLRRMRKGVTAIQNVQLLRACKQHGVRPHWNYLVGFPGETDQDYEGQENLFRSLSHLDPPFFELAGQVRFDRFSPYTTHSEELGVSGLSPNAVKHFTLLVDQPKSRAPFSSALSWPLG